MRKYLIGYDITDPKRLIKIHKLASKIACPIQYSLFLYLGTQKQLKHDIQILIDAINPREDDLRCYELPSNSPKIRLGRASLPEGVFWSGLTVANAVNVNGIADCGI